MWPVPFSVERAWSRIASQPILEQVEIFLLAPYRNTFRFRSEIQFIATTNHPTYVNHVFSRQQDSVVVNDDSSRRPRHRTNGPNSKIPPKIRFFKNREIDRSFFCLQQFDKCSKKALHAMTGNGSYVNLLTLSWNLFLWNHCLEANLFSSSLSHLGPLT